MCKVSVRYFILFLVLAVVPFLAVGCGGGGGGGGEGLTASGPSPVGSAGVWRMTASGFIDEKSLPQPAPDRLEAPDRQEAPAIPGVGYTVRAVNAVTGQILATALSGADGAWKLTFATPKTSDMAVVLIAMKEKIILRAILPMKSADLYTMAQGSNYNVTMQMAISQSTENVVQAIEAELGLNKGDFGKLTTFPGAVTTASVIAKAEEHGFILQASGSFTFIGSVDIGDLTPAPTFSVSAGTAKYNIPFGSPVNLSGTVTAVTGSLTGRNLTYQWTKTAGPTGSFTSATSQNATFTTADQATAMAFNQAYVNTNYPGTIARYDRFGIVPLNAQEGQTNFVYTLRLTVTDVDSGNSAYGTVTVAHLARQSGLTNVALGLPVLLNAPDAASYAWTLSGPSGSTAALQGADTKNPYFVPDVAGTYEIAEATAGPLTIYAGTYTGIAAKYDATDDPEIPAIDPVNNGCLTACHNGTYAVDLSVIFTEWAETPHAKLFKEELNDTSTAYHYSSSCTGCHTVGQEPAANNGGFDDVQASTGYVIQAAPNTNAHQFSALVQSKPTLAALGAIECENCHGPSTSDGHEVTAARVSYDASVCMVCHGKPGNHNRGQLWQQSGHANTELAVDEGNSTNCSRCHTAQGFVKWLSKASTTADVTLASSDITWTEDNVQSQTCVACHDPHSQSNITGRVGSATFVSNNHLRIFGNTFFLPAGFQATNVGKGAVCMMCHNSRRGHRDDTTGLAGSTSMAHRPAQTDVLMGQNAYFIGAIDTTTFPYRSPHATTALGTTPKALKAMPDTCVTCHMDLVPATSSGSGTNHKFKITASQVCAKCHGEGMTATPLEMEVEDAMSQLMGKITSYIVTEVKKKPTVTLVVNALASQAEATSILGSDGLYINQSSDPVVVDTTKIQSLSLYPGTTGLTFIIEFTEAQTISCALNANQVNCDANFGTDKTATDTRFRLSLSNIHLVGTTTDLFTATSAPDLFKGAWNYFLISVDGSKGIHNRPFAKMILEAAYDATWAVVP